MVLVLLSTAFASGFFQRATVMGMQTTECIGARHSVMAALSGANDTSRHENCSEYILVSPTAVFRVQATKSAPLLLPSEEVNFRTGKGSLIVRRDDQQEDFEVKVVCMQLRSNRHDSCVGAVEAIATSSSRASR
jgi:hypothetical protein